MEQISLAKKKPQARSYSKSPQLLALNLKTTSTKAYETLPSESGLTLPSVRTLHRLGKQLYSGDNVEYFNRRIELLSDKERNVILLFDEIYVAQRVEYSGSGGVLQNA